MPAQGRLGDKSQVPADAHGCPACPHPAVGPAILGSPNVKVNKMPALRVGDKGVHAACCNGNHWEAKAGASTVFINGKAAHRMGDADQHCGGMGRLIEGSPNVTTGDSGGGGGGGGGSSSSSSSSGGGGGGGGGGGAGAGGGGGGSATASSSSSSAASSSSTAANEAAQQQEQRWVELELVDEDGQPVAGVRVRITPSAGPPVELTSDANGIVRANDIEPGQCTITLPDHDANAWRR